MDTYKLVVELRGFGATDADEDYMKIRIEDDLCRLIDIAHDHNCDVLSIYLIKATNCAPKEEGIEN